MLVRGASFQLKDFNTGDWTHPWILVTTPGGPDGNALCFNWTTQRAWVKDLSCILVPGDHPAVTAASVVNYGEHARPQTFCFATFDLSNPNIKTWPAVSGTVLDKIHHGALRTRLIEPKFLKMVKAELGIP